MTSRLPGNGYPQQTVSRPKGLPAPLGLGVAALVLVVTGCVESQTPVSPPTEDTHPVVVPANQASEVQARLAERRTLREEFVAMAARIPGGFGGLYFDDEGTLVAILRDTGASASARAALAREMLVEERVQRGDSRFDMSAVRIVSARYTYSQLDSWLKETLAQMGAAPVVSGVRVRTNTLLIGVRSPAQQADARRAASQVGVPNDALTVESWPEPVELTSLSNQIRPVPGGVEITYSGYGLCTLGVNAKRLGQSGFITASHCSGVKFGYDVKHYYQGGGHIGNEGIDPEVFPCAESLRGCRNSDAMLGLYAGGVSSDFGYIAKPITRNTGSTTIDAVYPRFRIVSEFNWAVTGETLEKVGRTTGWSGGQVVDGCLDLGVTGGTVRCIMLVNAPAGLGDSGSPVFEITNGTDVRLRGVLFGGDTCLPPAYTQCSRFYASNLGGIEMDLDPDGNAPLTYR